MQYIYFTQELFWYKAVYVDFKFVSFTSIEKFKSYTSLVYLFEAVYNIVALNSDPNENKEIG